MSWPEDFWVDQIDLTWWPKELDLSLYKIKSQTKLRPVDYITENIIISSCDPDARRAREIARLSYKDKRPQCWCGEWDGSLSVVEEIQCWPPVYVMSNKKKYRGVLLEKPVDWPEDHHWPPILDGIIVSKSAGAYVCDTGYHFENGKAPYL